MKSPVTNRVTDLELCFNPESGGFHSLLQLRKLRPHERRAGVTHEEIARASFEHHEIGAALRQLYELMGELRIAQATIIDRGKLLLVTMEKATVKRNQLSLWINSRRVPQSA